MKPRCRLHEFSAGKFRQPDGARAVSTVRAESAFRTAPVRHETGGEGKRHPLR